MPVEGGGGLGGYGRGICTVFGQYAAGEFKVV